jgi:hypothetical protein
MSSQGRKETVLTDAIKYDDVLAGARIKIKRHLINKAAHGMAIPSVSRGLGIERNSSA